METIMPDTENNLDAIREEYIHFPDEFNSVMMATINADGTPDASYAVYIFHDSAYYIYISELAQHTENLMRSGSVSLLFIESEEKAQNPFARQRMTLQCSTDEVERDSEHFNQVLDLFEHRYGPIAQMLRALTDFHLFRIEPQSGSYVRGFAQAYKLYGEGLRQIRHINDKGHRAKDSETQRKMDDQISDI
jgi:heme iron utilization protein